MLVDRIFSLGQEIGPCQLRVVGLCVCSDEIRPTLILIVDRDGCACLSDRLPACLPACCIADGRTYAVVAA